MSMILSHSCYSCCLMTSVVSCTAVRIPLRVCVSAAMDGCCCSDCKPLQVVLHEWLWEQWGLNLPLKDHDQWVCEHTSHTHKYTCWVSSSLYRPLTEACLAMCGVGETSKVASSMVKTPFADTELAGRPSIFRWLTAVNPQIIYPSCRMIHKSLPLQVACLPTGEHI